MSGIGGVMGRWLDWVFPEDQGIEVRMNDLLGVNQGFLFRGAIHTQLLQNWSECMSELGFKRSE